MALLQHLISSKCLFNFYGHHYNVAWSSKYHCVVPCYQKTCIKYNPITNVDE